MRVAPLLLAVLLWVDSSTARGDIVIYRMPKIDPPLVIVLQGRAKTLPGRTVSYRHPKLRNARLTLSIHDTTVHETLSVHELFRRDFRRARSARDPEQVMETARWALDHVLLDQFHEAIEKTLELSPGHKRAKQLQELKQKLEQPVHITDEHRRYMRSVVPIEKMRFENSDHFLLMCDTPQSPGDHRRLPRAQERLELLESVYKCFLYRFYAQDANLDIPDEPLMAVLFNDQRDFKEYATQLSPELHKAAGFYDQETNITFFYNHGTAPKYQVFRVLAEQLKRKRDYYIKHKDRYAPGEVAKYRQMADTMCLLVEIAQENSDIEVVTHEVTHQMAGNTGLLPRSVRIPTWAHEGLATFFEAPKEASWSGIGAVNEERLDWYRALQRHRKYSNIDFVVRDEIFSTSANVVGELHGYGQSWGLTHFLMNERFDDLMRYYRRLGELPPDLIISSDVYERIFNEVFGDDRTRLDLQWRSYMRSLKTDLDIFLEEARR